MGEQGGVRCSAGLETSESGIFAAGDICEYQSPVHGKPMRIEHRDVAFNQGKTAASTCSAAGWSTRSCRTSSPTWPTGCRWRPAGVGRASDPLWVDGGEATSSSRGRRPTAAKVGGPLRRPRPRAAAHLGEDPGRCERARRPRDRPRVGLDHPARLSSGRLWKAGLSSMRPRADDAREKEEDGEEDPDEGHSLHMLQPFRAIA